MRAKLGILILMAIVPMAAQAETSGPRFVCQPVGLEEGIQGEPIIVNHDAATDEWSASSLNSEPEKLIKGESQGSVFFGSDSFAFAEDFSSGMNVVTNANYACNGIEIDARYAALRSKKGATKKRGRGHNRTYIIYHPPVERSYVYERPARRRAKVRTYAYEPVFPIERSYSYERAPKRPKSRRSQVRTWGYEEPISTRGRCRQEIDEPWDYCTKR